MRLYSYVLLLLFCGSSQLLLGQENVYSGFGFSDFKLENGLRVIVLKDSTSKDFTADLLVDYPLMIEGEYMGVGTLVSQGLIAGTKLHSKAEIDSLLHSANCTFDATLPRQLHMKAPFEEREIALSLLSEFVQQATFPEEEFAQLKAATQRKIEKAENSVLDQSMFLANRLSFGTDHPYGQRMTLESVANISSETCQQFYKKYYRPAISYLVVTSNLQAKEARFLVEKYFGSWSVKGAMFSAFYNPAPLPFSTRLSFMNIPGASDLSLDFGYAISLRPGTDDELKVALLQELLEERLRRTPLNENSKATFLADPHIGLFRIHADGFTPEIVGDVISDILDALKSMRNELVNPSDLAAAKAALLTKDFRFRDFLRESKRKANEALSIVRFKLPRNYYAGDVQLINSITPADLLEVAREYLLPRRAHIVIAGDQAIAPSLTRFAGDGKVHYYTKEGQEIEAMEGELAIENITAKEIVERYLAAIGGRSRLAAVKDFTLEAEAKLQSETLVMTRVKKNDKMFLGQFRIGDLNILKMIFDGQSARIIQGNRQEEVSEEDLAKFRAYAVVFPELNYQDEGYQLKVTGSAVLNNQNVHIIDVITPSGKLSSQYFDTNTGFLVRSVTTENDKTVIWDYLDYQGVDGLKFPHQLALTGLLEETLLFRVKSLKLNQGIPDDLFSVED